MESLENFLNVCLSIRKKGVAPIGFYSDCSLIESGYQAGLAITGASQGTSRVKFYAELGWESLSDHRIIWPILEVHKIIAEKTPKYLHDCPPHNKKVVFDLLYCH